MITWHCTIKHGQGGSSNKLYTNYELHVNLSSSRMSRKSRPEVLHPSYKCQCLYLSTGVWANKHITPCPKEAPCETSLDILLVSFSAPPHSPHIPHTSKFPHTENSNTQVYRAQIHSRTASWLPFPYHILSQLEHPYTTTRKILIWSFL